ncbi:MAG: signal peptidase I [Defluviitaleaceae bacterium]|nr:signal peptidase I [Defluviitaleaceae bacterium]
MEDRNLNNTEEEVDVLEDLEEQPPAKTRLRDEIFSWIKAGITAAVVALFVNNFVIVNAMVPTGSMETTIMTNDRIMAFRLSYLFNSPSRFDIIVFQNPNSPYLYIKRIIGMPGETVIIANGRVYIDGEFLEEDSTFIKEDFFGNHGPFFIGENEFFVMGDNRNSSSDSRFWQNPFVSEDLIVGRAVFKYFRGFEILR